jgi:hypothetical protein
MSSYSAWNEILQMKMLFGGTKLINKEKNKTNCIKNWYR